MSAVSLDTDAALHHPGTSFAGRTGRLLCPAHPSSRNSVRIAQDLMVASCFRGGQEMSRNATRVTFRKSRRMPLRQVSVNERPVGGDPGADAGPSVWPWHAARARDACDGVASSVRPGSNAGVASIPRDHHQHALAQPGCTGRVEAGLLLLTTSYVSPTASGGDPERPESPRDRERVSRGSPGGGAEPTLERSRRAADPDPYCVSRRQEKGARRCGGNGAACPSGGNPP